MVRGPGLPAVEWSVVQVYRQYNGQGARFTGSRMVRGPSLPAVEWSVGQVYRQ